MRRIQKMPAEAEEAEGEGELGEEFGEADSLVAMPAFASQD